MDKEHKYTKEGNVNGQLMRKLFNLSDNQRSQNWNKELSLLPFKRAQMPAFTS